MCSLLVKKGKVSGSHNYVCHVKLVLREGVDDDQQSWHIVKCSALFRKCSYVSHSRKSCERSLKLSAYLDAISSVPPFNPKLLSCVMINLLIIMLII